MNATERLVVRLPLENLWDGEGVLEADRGRELAEAEIKALLRLGPIAFVVADIGHPLNWVAPAQSFRFWKEEAQSHLYEQAKSYLDDYPGTYAYFAREWRLRDGRTVVVLEKQH